MSTPTLTPGFRPRRQRGVVLVVSLLMLLVLTVIGLAATRSTTIEQRLTAAQSDTAVAVQGAEAALRNGESMLNSSGLPNFALNTAGVYTATTWTGDWKSIDWDSASATLPYQGGLQPSPAVLPRYFVVLTSITAPGSSSSLSSDAPEVSKTVYFIYARSVGLRQDAKLSDPSAVVLQSIYAR